MGQVGQIDINNPANYRNCQKKQYEITVCVPPHGTVVINKLEQSEIVKKLNGKTYFTLEELNSPKYQQLVPQIKQAAQQGMCYIVDKDRPFVLAGTEGELWTIDPSKLMKTYLWADGQPINDATFSKKVNNRVLEWTRIKTKPAVGQSTTMACFVPKTQKFQIQTSWGSLLQGNVGQGHGKGDFIVCTKLPNGQPNLQDRWIVNGRIFAATYNNQGWTDCIEPYNTNPIAVKSLPQLITPDTKVMSSYDKVLKNALFKCIGNDYNFNGHYVQSSEFEFITALARHNNFSPSELNPVLLIMSGLQLLGKFITSSGYAESVIDEANIKWQDFYSNKAPSNVYADALLIANLCRSNNNSNRCLGFLFDGAKDYNGATVAYNLSFRLKQTNQGGGIIEIIAGLQYSGADESKWIHFDDETFNIPLNKVFKIDHKNATISDGAVVINPSCSVTYLKTVGSNIFRECATYFKTRVLENPNFIGHCDPRYKGYR